MSQSNIQSFKAKDVSEEELQLQKAQQVIDELFMAANSNEKLNQQLEAAISPESLVEIAASQGYELTVADLERLHDYDQEPAQVNSDELDNDELSEQDLELVAGGFGFIGPMPGPPWLPPCSNHRHKIAGINVLTKQLRNH